MDSSNQLMEHLTKMDSQLDKNGSWRRKGHYAFEGQHQWMEHLTEFGLQLWWPLTEPNEA
mgnify:CR=1 FL=1